MEDSFKIEFTGTIVSIEPTKTFNSGFCSRQFAVRVNDDAKYPDYLPLTLLKDKCEWLTGYNIDDRVHIVAYVGGRKWDGPNGTRYFADIKVSKLSPVGALKNDAPAPAEPPESVEAEVMDDDLPF